MRCYGSCSVAVAIGRVLLFNTLSCSLKTGLFQVLDAASMHFSGTQQYRLLEKIFERVPVSAPVIVTCSVVGIHLCSDRLALSAKVVV
jgi:hypothetical protein